MGKEITICLNYEYVIRQIYNCERGEVVAAEAGVVRHLQKACSEFESNPKDPQKAIEYGLSIGRISAFLVSAIEKIMAGNDKLQNDDLKKLLIAANNAESKNELFDVILKLSHLLGITE